MRLVYFAPSDIQVARVDRQCIVNFCDALQQIGVDVELVAMGIKLTEGETRASHPLDLYRIRRHFPLRLVQVPVSQLSSDWWIGLNRFVVHAICAFREAIRARRGTTTVLYAKNYGPAIALLAARAMRRARMRVVFEPHLPPPSRLHAAILRRCDRIAANTQALADELVASHGVDRSRVMGTHQGVDVDLYNELRVDAAVAREHLGLPRDAQLVVYTGKIFWGYAETEYIIEAARRLRNRDDIQFVLVGGRADHVTRYRELTTREELKNVVFTGFVAPNEVQMYQFAADVLLLYYPSGIAINRFRSPGKLFEYMASGRAIISVDLPVLREVIGEGDDEVAAMVPEDNPALLASSIERLLGDNAMRAKLASRALERVWKFTWVERAVKIVRFIDPTILLDTASGSTLVAESSIGAKYQ